MTHVYPLILEPILMPKVWGGDRLAKFGKKVQPGQAIGESWELADLASTSASGAGGSAARSTIRNGSLAGKTLHDAMTLWGGDLCFHAQRDAGEKTQGQEGLGNYPLLIKFLDAREDLSVQVHPSPEYASTHADAHLKTECWLILDAQPGSVIYKGVKPGVTRASFAKHIADNTVVNDMISVPARVGECHNLPSGTVHALGKGVLVAEVQTPSDTTFRVYDWGRTGRELHIEQALACIHWGPAPDAIVFDRAKPRGGSLTTEFFSIEQHTLDRATPVLEHAGGAMIVLFGNGEIHAGNTPVPVQAGDTIFLPSALPADASIVPNGPAITVLFAMPTVQGMHANGRTRLA